MGGDTAPTSSAGTVQAKVGSPIKSDHSDEAELTDYAESELDCSITESETCRFDALTQELDTVQQQVSDLMAISVLFERRVASAASERRRLQGLRLKLLYRNMAAALLGRLISTSAREFANYNAACKTSVKRLLELQDRSTVVRAAQKILRHLQFKLAKHDLGKNTSSAIKRTVRGSQKLAGGVAIKIAECV